MWCGISDSIKCGVISDRMGNCWLLRKDFWFTDLLRILVNAFE
jgi:hypothetical protein